MAVISKDIIESGGESLNGSMTKAYMLVTCW